MNKQPLEVEVRHAQDLKLKQFTDGNDKRADRVHYNESDFDYPELKVKECMTCTTMLELCQASRQAMSGPTQAIC